jgi:flagellar biosynthesis component FlhA
MIASMFAPQPPKNFEYRNEVEIIQFMTSLPFAAYVIAAIGGLVTSLAAGWIVTKVSRRRGSLVLPLIVGGFMTLGGILLYYCFPGQPPWFLIACIVITIPFALIGHRAASSRT